MIRNNLNYHLTNLDSFNELSIDIDKKNITKEKYIYNIYNNNIYEPFHNFWFLINYCKFIKYYDKNNIVCFALNEKNEEHKKILNTLENIANYVKNIFEEVFKNEIFTVIFLDKKEYNYPSILQFYKNDETNITNEKGNIISFENVKNNNLINYSVLFELNYITVKQNKIYLNLKTLTIQCLETKINNFLSLNNNNINNNYISSPQHNNTIINEEHKIKLFESIKQKTNDLTENKTIFKIDTNLLMQKKESLKKIQIDNSKDETKIHPGVAYLEQKKLLKNLSPNNEEELLINSPTLTNEEELLNKSINEDELLIIKTPSKEKKNKEKKNKDKKDKKDKKKKDKKKE